MASLATERRRNGSGRGVSVAASSVVRCALYTRKSTDEGLDSDFSSLDAQREACESYVASMRSEGWLALPDRYDDGAQSGATIERPALRRLLLDVETHRVDCVVVHRVDRLSRSLLDFGRLIELFEGHGAALVSVTQRLDTSTSMGRLTLNMLLSFAQFEREIIAERTRDKVRAARRRGKWTGGTIPIGYDLAPGGGKLVVNEPEAFQVREMFAAYARLGSLIDVAAWANEKGWRTKITGTHDGRTRGGVSWSKSSIHRTLSSPLYVGKLIVENEAYASESPAIVDDATWQAVQERLERNGGAHTRGERHKSDSLLAGLIFCGGCGAAMTPSSARKGPRVYRYYRCSRQVKHGRAACPAPHVSAPKVEAEVVAEIARVVRDTPTLIPEIVTAAKEQLASQKKSLASERRALGTALRRDDGRHATGHRARLACIEEQAERLAGVTIETEAVRDVVGEFHGLWDALTGRERRRVVEILVERVVVPADGGPVSKMFS